MFRYIYIYLKILVMHQRIIKNICEVKINTNFGETDF